MRRQNDDVGRDLASRAELYSKLAEVEKATRAFFKGL
jgi:hypothetical protein